MIEKRISILDSFRALAILSVLLFHYFSRWTPPLNKVSLYPYKNTYDYFGYGYLGVQFFFIISGFVIFFTLDNTTDFNTFWKKRFIRLFPSLLIASFTTIIFFRIFDTLNIFPESHEVKNLLPSLLFIQPTLLNSIFSINHPTFNYINGSYWSLWTEIQFYLLASIFYYTNKNNFLRNFSVVSVMLISANYLVRNVQGSNKLNLPVPKDFLDGYTKWIENGFDVVEHLHFFCLGVLFYLLFKNNVSKIKTGNNVKLFLLFLILFTLYSGLNMKIRLIFFLILLLFFGFIYMPKQLSFFENKTLTKIGESSYFLYLIHESIGVLIIYLAGSYFVPYGFILPILLMFVFIWLSNLYTSKAEKKISRWLKSNLLKRSKL